MIKNCNQTERSNTFFFTSKFLLIITLITIFVNSINISVLGAKTISQKEQEDVIKIVCERLDKVFAFPEKTKNICDGLHQNLKDGNYLNCTTPEEFADQLNNDLMKLSQDKHLGIMYDPQMAAEMKEEEKKEDGDAYLTPQMIEEERLNNFGFKKLEILPENIGYMDLRIFFAPQYAGKTAVAAMDFLSNCDAIIIDLRNNGGGWDEMVTLIMSYFFRSDEIITFSTSYSRFEDQYYQSRTLPYVPGKILSDIPLFLLTSRSTFSGAEAFAHYMKHFNKATLVGEGTRGGQSPVEIQAINHGFIIFIPSWKLINSVTNSSWEGVGVKPHIEVEASEALYTAQLEALKELTEKTTDENKKNKYDWITEGLKARKNPASLAQEILQSYTGKYGSIIIHYKNGELYYQRGDRSKMRMIPISDVLFLVDIYDYLRVNFIKENGIVVGMEQIYDDGNIKRYSKE